MRGWLTNLIWTTAGVLIGLLILHYLLFPLLGAGFCL